MGLSKKKIYVYTHFAIVKFESISMPSSNLLSSVFGRSPIGAIQRHIQCVHDCVAKLMPFFQAVVAKDWQRATQTQQDIVSLEHNADNIKRELRLSLPSSLFLPVPRTDLLELITVQDKIANRAKDIAGLIIGRQMVFPEVLHHSLLEYVQRSIDTSAQALKTINELDELLETGFKGREVEIVTQMITELDALETQTDELQIIIRKDLFSQEKSLPPVDVMFMYKIFEWIGDVADRASRVGSYLQLIVAK